MSSVEAEYMALRKNIAEVSWLVQLLSDLGVHICNIVPIYCDSQDVIHIFKYSIFYEHTNHIEIHSHYVRGYLNSGLTPLYFVPSSAQLPDIMTKALPDKLSVFSPSSLRGRGEEEGVVNTDAADHVQQLKL